MATNQKNQRLAPPLPEEETPEQTKARAKLLEAQYGVMEKWKRLFEKEFSTQDGDQQW